MNSRIASHPRAGEQYGSRGDPVRRRGFGSLWTVSASWCLAGRRPRGGRQLDLWTCTSGTTGWIRGSANTTTKSSCTSSRPGSRMAGVLVSVEEIEAWEASHPQPYKRDSYQGAYQDVTALPRSHMSSRSGVSPAHGLERTGAHGPVASMGVPRQQLPSWDDLQFVTAQLHRLPQLDEVPVRTELIVGPAARRAASSGDPDLRLRHELRRAVGGSEGRAVARRGAGRDGDRFRRGRHAAGGAV